MKDCDKYDFVIDDRFVHRMNRAFIMTFIWLVYISLFFTMCLHQTHGLLIFLV